MNKKTILKLLTSLSLAGTFSPLASAENANVVVENEIQKISLTENPFPELKQGYLFNSKEEYLKVIQPMVYDLSSKFHSLYDTIKKLNSKESQFKDFCSKILEDKSGNYSKYSEKWNEYVNDGKKELENYGKKLDDVINLGKELALLIESYKCYLKDNSEKLDPKNDKVVESVLYSLNVHIANKHYCDSWLNYANNNYDISNFDKDTINNIGNYPKYDDSVKQTKGEIYSWYNSLFTAKK